MYDEFNKFDKELKEQYIKSIIKKYDENAIIGRETLLSGIEKFETTENKSILDMTKFELKTFWINLGLVSENSFNTYFSYLREYILLSEQPNKNAFLAISTFTKKDKDDVIDDFARKTRYITQDEYEALCRKEANPMDRAVLILLWNGVLGKNKSELINIKTSDFDFDKGILKLYARNNPIKFNDVEINYLLEVTKTYQHYAYDLDMIKIKGTDYLHGEYYIKNMAGYRNQDATTNKTSEHVLGCRIPKYFNLIGVPYLTMKSVVQSGYICKALLNTKDKYLSDVELYDVCNGNVAKSSIVEIRPILSEKLIAEGYNVPIRKHDEYNENLDNNLGQ